MGISVIVALLILLSAFHSGNSQEYIEPDPKNLHRTESSFELLPNLYIKISPENIFMSFVQLKKSVQNILRLFSNVDFPENRCDDHFNRVTSMSTTVEVPRRFVNDLVHLGIFSEEHDPADMQRNFRANNYRGPEIEIFGSASSTSNIIGGLMSVQHGSCGVKGHRIYVTEDYLKKDFDVDEVLGVWAMVNYGIFPQRGCPGDREFPETLHAIMATNGSYLEVQKIPEPCDMEGDEAPVTCFNRRSVTATHPAGDEGVSDQISFDNNKRFMQLYSEATMPRYRKSPQSVRCSWLSAWDVAQRMKAIPHTREAGPSSPSSETRKKVASGSRLPHDEQFPDVKWIISPDGEADSKSFRFTPSGPSIEVWTDVIIPRFPGQIGIGVYALVSWDGPISPNIEISVEALGSDDVVVNTAVLLDDGLNPDLHSRDGIFSGVVMMTPTFPTSTSSSSIREIRALRIQTTAGRAPRRRRDFTLGGVFSPQAFSEGCHQKPFAHAGELFPAFSGFVEILPTLTTRKASRLLQNFKLFPRHQRPARLSSVSNFSLAFIANSDLEFTAAWKYDHNIDENDSKDEPGFAMICSRETQISGTSRHDNELIPKDEYGKCIIRGKSAKEAAKARQFGRNGGSPEDAEDDDDDEDYGEHDGYRGAGGESTSHVAEHPWDFEGNSFWWRVNLKPCVDVTYNWICCAIQTISSVDSQLNSKLSEPVCGNLQQIQLDDIAKRLGHYETGNLVAISDVEDMEILAEFDYSRHQAETFCWISTGVLVTYSALFLLGMAFICDARFKRWSRRSRGIQTPLLLFGGLEKTGLVYMDRKELLKPFSKKKRLVPDAETARKAGELQRKLDMEARVRRRKRMPTGRDGDEHRFHTATTPGSHPE